MKSGYYFLLLTAFVVSCERPLPTISGLDGTKWKNDKNGCNGARQSMSTSLEEQKTKLQGLSETQILQLLGRPDQNELYKRNQKFYYYWITGPDCSTDSTKLKLGIRFTAMGISKEISFD
jgi:hypothetical protein